MPTLAFSVLPTGVAHLHDLLSCLSKFDENVSLEACYNSVSISFILLYNYPADFLVSHLESEYLQTAYASFTLAASTFFAKYSFSPDARSASSKVSGEPSWNCFLQNRALLSIFKRRIAEGKDKDTAIERCEVELQAKSDQTKCRLIVRMLCRHGVVKTYRLTYESAEVLHASFDKTRSENYWTVSSRTLRDIVEYFGPKTEQLDWYFEKGKVIFTSYTEKVQHGREILKQPIHTSVALERKDFDDFNVQEGLHIGIIVKDFRAIISHAEAMRTNVTAKYSRGNRPMQISYERDGLLAEYTLMTRGHTSNVPNGSATSTPARDLSVRPVSRPSNEDRAPSIPATTQSLQTMPPMPPMPPPSVMTSMSEASPGSRITQAPRNNAAPAPSASINPDSLFIPADDDQQWDEPNYEEEPDIVTWNAPDPSFTDSGRRIRDSEPTSFQSAGGQQPEMCQFAPTQRLSQVKDSLIKRL